MALADARKGVGMFLMDSINVPLLGIVENMAYFTPLELPNNKYYIFGKDGGKLLATQFNVPFLGEIPLLKSISDSGDEGNPIILQNEDIIEKIFIGLAEQVAQQIAIHNAKK